MSKASDEVLVEFLQRVEEASAGSIPQATREILLGSSEREAKDELRRLLATTHSASIRNAAAIALGDLEDPEAIGIVRRLLNESTTVGARGSLLYALRGRDVVKILPELVSCIMHGAYEERHEAMSLVRSIDAVVDADVIERSIERVEAAVDAAQADSDIDRLSLLTELLAALKDAS